jgi:hypothetical protein
MRHQFIMSAEPTKERPPVQKRSEQLATAYRHWNIARQRIAEEQARPAPRQSVLAQWQGTANDLADKIMKLQRAR